MSSPGIAASLSDAAMAAAAACRTFCAAFLLALRLGLFVVVSVFSFFTFRSGSNLGIGSFVIPNHCFNCFSAFMLVFQN